VGAGAAVVGHTQGRHRNAHHACAIARSYACAIARSHVAAIARSHVAGTHTWRYAWGHVAGALTWGRVAGAHTWRYAWGHVAGALTWGYTRNRPARGRPWCFPRRNWWS
jgi:hypothetical protein